MQKWEYTWLYIDNDKIIGKRKGDKEFSNGKTASEYIDYLGGLGWELVSVTPCMQSMSYHLYWFKRPIE